MVYESTGTHVEMVDGRAFATRILSVHKLRRVARRRENEIQAALKVRDEDARMLLTAERDLLREVPDWAHGVRVERADLFQHAVVATEQRGH